MGVTGLWSILSPVRRHLPLEELCGQRIAVDLSIWIVEAQTIKQIQGIVNKPYLRHIFFRISQLLQLGVLPVFVIDGQPPEVKWDCMMKRQLERLGPSANRGPPRKQTRSHFKAINKECCRMLDCLGIPYVQSCGEAEAMCALLDREKVVDGCITDDGDAFLYGARTVYRHFTIDRKDPHVEVYKMDQVERRLGLNREKLVTVALMLGCDYLPNGVPGVGREMTLKLLSSLKDSDVIQRIREWPTSRSLAAMEEAASIKKQPHCATCRHPGTAVRHRRTGCTLCGLTHDCAPRPASHQCQCEWHTQRKYLDFYSAELAVRRKALAVPYFPHEKVLQEFLIEKDRVPAKKLFWKPPELRSFQLYMNEKLEWPGEYGREKLLPLLTLWTLKRTQLSLPRDAISSHKVPLYTASTQPFLKPHSIVKTRVRNGVPSLEICWLKLSDDVSTVEPYYTTIEREDLFRTCYPTMVKEFEDMLALKKKPKPRGPPKKKNQAAIAMDENEVTEDNDDVLTQLHNLSIQDPNINERDIPKTDTMDRDEDAKPFSAGPVLQSAGVSVSGARDGGNEFPTRSHSQINSLPVHSGLQPKPDVYDIQDEEAAAVAAGISDTILDEFEESIMLPLSERLALSARQRSNQGRDVTMAKLAPVACKEEESSICGPVEPFENLKSKVEVEVLDLPMFEEAVHEVLADISTTDPALGDDGDILHGSCAEIESKSSTQIGPLSISSEIHPAMVDAHRINSSSMISNPVESVYTARQEALVESSSRREQISEDEDDVYIVDIDYGRPEKESGSVALPCGVLKTEPLSSLDLASQLGLLKCPISRDDIVLNNQDQDLTREKMNDQYLGTVTQVTSNTSPLEENPVLSVSDDEDDTDYDSNIPLDEEEQSFTSVDRTFGNENCFKSRVDQRVNRAFQLLSQFSQKKAVPQDFQRLNRTVDSCSENEESMHDATQDAYDSLIGDSQLDLSENDSLNVTMGAVVYPPYQAVGRGDPTYEDTIIKGGSNTCHSLIEKEHSPDGSAAGVDSMTSHDLETPCSKEHVGKSLTKSAYNTGMTVSKSKKGIATINANFKGPQKQPSHLTKLNEMSLFTDSMLDVTPSMSNVSHLSAVLESDESCDALETSKMAGDESYDDIETTKMDADNDESTCIEKDSSLDVSNTYCSESVMENGYDGDADSVENFDRIIKSPTNDKKNICNNTTISRTVDQTDSVHIRPGTDTGYEGDLEGSRMMNWTLAAAISSESTLCENNKTITEQSTLVPDQHQTLFMTDKSMNNIPKPNVNSLATVIPGDQTTMVVDASEIYNPAQPNTHPALVADGDNTTVLVSKTNVCQIKSQDQSHGFLKSDTWNSGTTFICEEETEDFSVSPSLDESTMLVCATDDIGKPSTNISESGIMGNPRIGLQNEYELDRPQNLLSVLPSLVVTQSEPGNVPHDSAQIVESTAAGSSVSQTKMSQRCKKRSRSVRNARKIDDSLFGGFDGDIISSAPDYCASPLAKVLSTQHTNRHIASQSKPSKLVDKAAHPNGYPVMQQHHQEMKESKVTASCVSHKGPEQSTVITYIDLDTPPGTPPQGSHASSKPETVHNAIHSRTRNTLVGNKENTQPFHTENNTFKMPSLSAQHNVKHLQSRDQDNFKIDCSFLNSTMFKNQSSTSNSNVPEISALGLLGEESKSLHAPAPSHSSKPPLTGTSLTVPVDKGDAALAKSPLSLAERLRSRIVQPKELNILGHLSQKS